VSSDRQQTQSTETSATEELAGRLRALPIGAVQDVDAAVEVFQRFVKEKLQAEYEYAVGSFADGIDEAAHKLGVELEG
jgi:hypothetical protein